MNRCKRGAGPLHHGRTSLFDPWRSCRNQQLALVRWAPAFVQGLARRHRQRCKIGVHQGCAGHVRVPCGSACSWLCGTLCLCGCGCACACAVCLCLCLCLCLCQCLLAIAVWLQLSWWVGDKGDGAGTTAWHAGRACSPWPHRSWPRHSNAAPPFDSPLARCRRHRHDRWCRRHSPNPARRLMVERCPTVNTTTTTSRTRLTRTREDLRVWHRRVAPLTVAWW